jgi:hypothetical protein
MGKNQVVKPDHFKVAGRERPGKNVAVEVQKQQFSKIEESTHSGKRRPKRG